MKKIITLILLICLTTSIGTPSIPKHSKVRTEKYQQSEYDKALERAFRLVKPTEIVAYVIQQSFIENVDPTDMVAILHVENPNQKVDAENKNIKKVWNKKKKKYVLEVVSTDNGLFQLNSEYIQEFIQKFWTPHETETFDVNNYKHNTRVAIRLYKSLLKSLNSQDLAVCAYNGGSGNVARNTIPQRTLEKYLPDFKRYKEIMMKE